MMVYRISLRHVVIVAGVLVTLICVVHVSLIVLLTWQHSSSGSVSFARIHGRRVLYISNQTKTHHTGPINKNIIAELDRIQIRVDVRTRVYESPKCSRVAYTPPAPDALEETFAWQAVTSDLESYVFSAYYESRTDPPAVRIIGISTESSGKFCLLWYTNETLPEIVEAETVILPESHDTRYSAVFFMCYIPPNHHQIPYAVSLVRDACQPPVNFLKIINNKLPASYKVNFTVCISPLNFHFDDYDRLVEIIEVNRIFGAEHFILYNHTTGLNVDRYLASYEADKIASVIPWKIPVVVNVYTPDPGVVPEIHYFGQVAALNDCLYRSMLKSRFVVFTDLDELIVPRADDNWLDMIARVTDDWFKSVVTLKRREMFPGSYLVQNVFFRLDWDDVRFEETEGRDKQTLKLMTLGKLRREKDVYPWYYRSKYIVWSKMTVSLSIHSVFRCIDDDKVNVVRVGKEHALVHHYRMWDGVDGASVGHLVDDRMRHFTGKIVESVARRHRQVGQVKAG